MNYNNPEQSGRDDFMRGALWLDNPVDSRTHANAHLLWQLGWDKQSKVDTCIGPNCNAIKGVGHSVECQNQHNSMYDNID